MAPDGPGFPGLQLGVVISLVANQPYPKAIYFNIRKQLRLKSQHSDMNSARKEIRKCAALGLVDSELP